MRTRSVVSSARGAGEALLRTFRTPRSFAVGLVVGSQYAAGVIALLTSVVAARLLRPVDFGVASVVMAFPTLLWSLANVKSASVITRFIVSFKAMDKPVEVRNVSSLGYLLDLITGAVPVLLIWGIAEEVTSALGLGDVAWLVRIFSVSIPFFGLSSTSLAVLSALGQFRWLSALQTMRQGLTLLLVTALLLAGFGRGGLIIGTAASQALFGIIMAAVATVALARDGQGLWWHVSWAGIRSQWQALRTSIGWSYAFVSFTGLLAQATILLLSHVRGPAEAGFFRLASGLAVTGAYLESGLVYVAHPTLAERWVASGRSDVSAMLRRWTSVAGVPASIAVLLTIPFLPFFISLAFGDAYTPVARGTQILMLGVAAGVLFFWLTPYYYTVGPLGIWTLGYGAYATLVIAFGLPVVSRWGYLGLATLVAGGRTLFVLGMAWYARRRLHAGTA